jgi:hypothetical protein
MQAQNRIQTENANPGTSNWQLANPATAREIEGYASLTSVNVGGRINFFVSTRDTSFNIEIFRTGWYNGAGARLLTTVNNLPGVLQTTPAPDRITGLIECHWSNSYTLTVPQTWTSGVFLARLTGKSSGKQSFIIFVVRDDVRTSDLLFESSVTTFQAYNFWPGGNNGKSLYDWAPGGRAWKVSFNRPYVLGYSFTPGTAEGAATGVGAGEYITNVQPGPSTGYPISAAGWEYNMVRWLERNGYDVTYATNIDVHENPNLLLNHKGFLSVGHNEYWSMPMRLNVQSALSKGVNAAFFSGNTLYWQVRLEAGFDGTADRTITCYKDDAQAHDPLYSSNPSLATVRWRDAPVNMPEAALLGVEYVEDPWDGDIVISDASHWLLNGSGLKNGDHLSGINGYEVDAFVPDVSPGSTSIIASSPVAPYTSGDPACDTNCSSNTTWYNTGKGSVFSSGSIQWSWGLDDYNAPALRPAVSNAAAQQITRNVLASFITPITITVPSNLPDGIIGQPYSQTFTASGGAAPLTWTATGLPSYLTLSSTGILSGTPPNAATITFNVTITDASRKTASGAFTLRIPAPMRYKISGQITTSAGGLAGVTVTLSTGPVTTTDASGKYSFSNLSGGTYTVTPSLQNYTFSPPSQTLPGIMSDQVANFTVNGPPARVISIDFVGSGTAMSATESAGVISKPNWNSAIGNTRSTPLSLFSESGVTTGATVTWTSDSTWAMPVTDSPGNLRMMRGYLDTGGGNPTTINIAGLPASLSGYDVYLYTDGDNGSASKMATYTISGSGITSASVTAIDAANTNFTSTFRQAAGSAGNYVKFTVQATSFTITARPGQSSNPYMRAPVNGIQIVPSTQVVQRPAALSIDFVGSGTPMDPAETAGVVSKANWNGVNGNSNSTPFSLVDENGMPTGASVVWTSDNNWATPIINSAGNARMMKGYLDTGGGNPTTITVSGLAASAGGYDVYVYLDADNSSLSKTATYTISGSGVTTTSVTATDPPNTNFSGTFQRANNSAGNYVKFTITATSFTITATPGQASDSRPRAPVNGIQVVPSSP